MHGLLDGLLRLRIVALSHAGTIAFFDGGWHQPAASHFDELRRCAAALGDADAESHGMAREASRLIYASQPQDAAELATAALAGTARDPWARADLHCHLADAHAALGDADAALAALAQARQEWAAAVDAELAGGPGRPFYLPRFDDRQLDGVEGAVRLRLGGQHITPQVVPLLRHALGGLEAKQPERATVAADLALAYLLVDLGQPDAAGPLLFEAALLAREIGSFERRQRVIRAWRVFTERFRRTSAWDELRDALWLHGLLPTDPGPDAQLT